MPPLVPPRQRIDRLELLLRVLADRPGVTADVVARDFGVSTRTVFRDLDALRRRGYPVEADRGRGGGLRLHPRYGLGRVVLARDEALCALLALAVAERLGFPMFGAELRRARRRLTDAFPSAERRRLGPLRERVHVGAPASAAVRASYAEPDPAVARPLQAAFVDERVVRATYARGDGAARERRLEPHALLVNWPAWYLVAHDHLRRETRTFRLDRFTAVHVEDERFRPRPRDVLRHLVEDGVVLDAV